MQNESTAFSEVLAPVSGNPAGGIEPALQEGHGTVATPLRRPQILFVVDVPGWAHDRKTDNLIRCLAEWYDCRKVFRADLKYDHIAEADLVVVYYWFIITQMPDINIKLPLFRHKLIIGSCSEIEFGDHLWDQGIKFVNENARYVFVNSRILYDFLKDHLEPTIYFTPNGVDTNFFRPRPRTLEPDRPLRIGWAGSLTNHGDKRGFHEFIEPAVRSLTGVELRYAASEERLRTADEMLEFYNGLDAYICASRHEGTPNPNLEAMACGVPVISTPVGNMPDLLVDGVNGLFCERDIDNIAARIAYLRDHRAEAAAMGQNAQLMIKLWDWTIQARNYRLLFDEALKPRSAAPQITTENGAGDGSQGQLLTGFKAQAQAGHIRTADVVAMVQNQLEALRAEMAQREQQEIDALRAELAQVKEGEARRERLSTLLRRLKPESLMAFGTQEGEHGAREGAADFEFDAERDTALSNPAPAFDQVLHVFHAEWFGIRAAAGAQPGQKLAITVNRPLTQATLLNIIEASAERGVTRVVAHGMSDNMARLLRAFKAAGGGTRLYGVWHGTMARWSFENELALANQFLGLHKEGVFDRVNFLRIGLDVLVEARVFAPYLFNVPPRVTVERTNLPFTSRPAKGYFPAWNLEGKNFYANLAALQRSEAIDQFFTCTGFQWPPNLPLTKYQGKVQWDWRDQFHLLAQMDLAMAVSIVDCHPMVPLEALAVGTPSLTGPLTFDALTEHPFVGLTMVEDPFDVRLIAERIDLVASVDPPELQEMITDFRGELIRVSRQRYSEFLEL